MIFPDGTIANGMVYSASDNTPYIFGDGCIFENCTFINPCTFGEGCIFIRCRLVDAYPSTKNTQPHRTGKGCIFDKGTIINYTITGNANVWGDGYQVGFRPNTPGPNLVITESSEHTADANVKTTGCDAHCGKLVVVNNGLKYNGPVIVPSDEVKGGPDVESSGVCPNPCD